MGEADKERESAHDPKQNGADKNEKEEERIEFSTASPRMMDKRKRERERCDGRGARRKVAKDKEKGD